MKTPQWLKEAKETLVEKATTGKMKYATLLIPGIGDYYHFNNVTKVMPKESKVFMTLIYTGLRTAGIAASLATDSLPLSILYLVPIGQEEMLTSYMVG